MNYDETIALKHVADSLNFNDNLILLTEIAKLLKLIYKPSIY